MNKETQYDVVIIGGGAAGMMAAIECGKRGRQVLLLEREDKPGKKILISGGGRCNFTNLNAAAGTYVSDNRHFAKSALKRFSEQDFIALVQKHGIAFHEKKLGQLFCDDSAQDIVAMLMRECAEANVTIWCDFHVRKVEPVDSGFLTIGEHQRIVSNSLVVACGGLSIPKIGATDLAFRLADKFDLKVVTPRPGLVPFTFDKAQMAQFSDLAGVSADVVVSCGKQSFRENLLFTHRGVSGPAILQISSFWTEGEDITLDFLPDVDLMAQLRQVRKQSPKMKLSAFFSKLLAARLATRLLDEFTDFPELGNLSDKQIDRLQRHFKQRRLTPNGTEGYRKAEVTVGGVSTAELSSKSMEVKSVPGLYFVGEAVDVTGFLGGYNFQWAWSSGYAAGQFA